MTCPTCHKGQRALYYCRRGDCPSLFNDRTPWFPPLAEIAPSRPPAPPLPPPTVDATVAGGTVDVVISRDEKARSYRGEGNTTQDAVKDVVKKILDDPNAAEYVRRG